MKVEGKISDIEKGHLSQQNHKRGREMQVRVRCFQQKNYYLVYEMLDTNFMETTKYKNRSDTKIF